MLYKFCVLILKSLGRNKVRTSLTGLGVAVLVCVYSIVTSVTNAVSSRVNAQGSQTRLICTDRWVAPSWVPVRYIPDLSKEPGVEDWTTVTFFPCFFDTTGRPDRRGAGIATRPENIRTMHAELDQLDEKLVERLKQRKDGAIVAPSVLKVMNWQIGKQITVYGAMFPLTEIKLTIIGELPSGQLPGFYFRDDYLREVSAEKSAVGAVILRIKDPSDAERVATSIRSRYERRQPSLKVETESAGVARFVERAASILGLIKLVVVVLLLDMVVILSNSISISVRERRVEMAVLKVLGFQPLHIMTMVIIEAMLIGALAGAAGTVTMYALSKLTLSGVLPVTMATRFLLHFPVSPAVIGQGILLGAVVGLSGSFFPALSARKVKVSDVFARIA